MRKSDPTKRRDRSDGPAVGVSTTGGGTRSFWIDESKKDAVVISPSSTESLAGGSYHARVIRVAFAAAVAWATVMGASEACAQIVGQTLTWVGGNGTNWSTRQNWLPEEIPSRGDNLVFPASPFRITTNDLVDLSVESVTIRDNYTIGGLLALEITGDAGLRLEGAVTATVALNLALSREPTNIAVGDGGTLEISGRVTARNFVKQGGGTLVLSGANDEITDLVGEDGCGVIRATNPLALGVSLVGRIQLGQNCTLQVEADTTLDKPIILNGMGAPGTTGAVVITAGVTLTERLELRLDAPAKIGVLSGATLDLPDSQVGLTTNLNSPLTVNVAQAGAVRMSRLITGIGDLIKEGAGSLFLNKNNTYNGQTVIRGGTVVIDGQQPDSPVVLDGGTVSGGGTIGTISATAAGGTISVARGGTEFMFSSSVTMNATTTLEVEFNGNQHDQLFVNGSVALNGAVLSAIGQFPPNQPATILDNDLNDAVIGTFAGLPQNARVIVAGLPMRISYTGGSGNDVVLTPEVLAVPGYEVLTGTYVGNGVDNRPITGLGFQPDLVIVKSATAGQGVARTSTMTGDVSKQMGTGTILADSIQTMDPSGFTVGTNISVNASGTTYQWVAWKTGVNEMQVGTYTGTGASQSIAGLSFSPDIVFVLGNNADEPVHKVSAVTPTTTAFSFSGGPGGDSTNYITALGAVGFTVGTDTRVNQTGVLYHYVAWNEVPGKIDVGTYTGSGADNRNITGVGFQPDFVMVQIGPAGPGNRPPVAHSTAMGPSTDTSHLFGAFANRANEIQQLQSGGFQVGTEFEVNRTGDAYFYAAWGRLAPTAVRMARMSARRTETGVVLDWRTGYEVDNLGFHVYRGPENGRVRLTTSLLAGSGLQQSSGIATGSSHSYRWSDETAGASASDVEYWVEEVSITGERTWHGPIRPGMRTENGRAEANDLNRAAPSERVQIAAASAASTAAGSSPQRETTGTAVLPAQRSSALLRGPSRSGGVAAPVSAEQALEAQWSIASQAAVKIDIASRGWYRVTQPDLVAAGLPVPVDPSLLQLFVDGVEQPMRVKGAANGRFGRNDWVEFYATGADTPYTGIRTYWIVAGGSAGQRIPVVDGRQGGLVGPSSFPSSFELKPRSIFFGALMNGDKENFFGPLIMPGEPTSQVIDLPDVIAPAPADAEIEVALQGVTEIDHRVGVRVNGIDVGEVTFTGRDAGVGTFAIAQALLIDGANAVSLDARGGELDHTLIDYIRVTYHRRYRARANRLTFTADAGQQVAVAGFTDAGIRVIDITGDVASQEVRGRISRDGAEWKVTLAVPGTGSRTLLAVATDAAASPVALRANVPSTLHQAGQAGDIIMIAPAAFQAALAPLKTFREGQGYTVRLVDIEDVYDEFSFGSKTPQAIKDFLVHAAAEWSRPPRFLLLVGNATQDPRDYLGLGEVDYVPTKVIQTGAMETASEDWFVDSDDDGFADLAIVGRLPARTDAQVAAMVSKIIAYEQSGDGAWQRSVLMVSDRDPAGLVDYADLIERARTLLPGNYQVTHLRRGTDPDAGQLVKARLSEGAALVSYAGHGSVASWQLDLLTTEDVPRLTNGSKLPVVVALNCFNGLFYGLFPEESLAEALVRAPNGGAVGVWASSGLTSPQWQWRMNVELYRQIFQGGWLTIGEAMRAAKQIVGDPDVRSTWIYFGDPVTRFTGLQEGATTTIAGAATTSTPQGLMAAPGRGDVTDAEHGTEPAAPSQRAAVRLADLDADGRDDPFLADAQSGSWFSALGPGEFPHVPGRRLVAGEPIAVDLNGDGFSDLFVYDASTGGWLQAMNLNDGRLITYSGSWAPGYRLSAGDFDGDGRDELFGLSGETGAWFQALPDGRGGFTYQFGIGLHDGDVRVADFDADSRDDVFVYEVSTGRWTLMLSNADGPTVERGTWGTGWDVTVAHLNTDRRADLVLWDGVSGAWSGCIPDNAASFVCSSGRLPAGGRIQPLDRNGDGRDELLRYDARTGSWTLIGVSPSGRVNQAEGVWEPGWSVASGDLDGDGRDDMALYNSETGELIKRLSRGSKWQDEVSEAWPAGWLMVGRRP
jgi:autotransporter-associated beta strand protein